MDFNRVIASPDTVQVFSTYWDENAASYNAAMIDSRYGNWPDTSCASLQKAGQVNLKAIDSTYGSLQILPPLLNLQRWY